MILVVLVSVCGLRVGVVLVVVVFVQPCLPLSSMNGQF